VEGNDDVEARLDAATREAGRRRAQPPAGSAAPDTEVLRLKAEALARPDAHRAGRDVLGALLPQPELAADEWWHDEPAPAPAVPVRQERVSTPVGPSTTVRFPPKRGARRVMGFVVLVTLIAAAASGYMAYADPNTLSIGVASTLGVLLLVTWGIRAGTPLTRMAIKGGQLEVRQGGLHMKFDLTSHYTPIEVQGTPGRRGWRVLFGRGTLRPFVVDSSIVDPAAFTEVLRRYRPE
jgi:hypothetical protein